MFICGASEYGGDEVPEEELLFSKLSLWILGRKTVFPTQLTEGQVANLREGVPPSFKKKVMTLCVCVYWGELGGNLPNPIEYEIYWCHSLEETKDVS